VLRCYHRSPYHEAFFVPQCHCCKDDPRGSRFPSENHCPFRGVVCLAHDSATSNVPVTIQVYYAFLEFPNATTDGVPNYLYHGAMQYQQVGVRLNGVHFKGPLEVEGHNMVFFRDRVEIVDDHGPFLDCASDGFGICGFQDLVGTPPDVDECNRHFGPVYNDKLGEVVCHYHIHAMTTLPSVIFDKQEPSFQPLVQHHHFQNTWHEGPITTGVGLAVAASFL